MLLFNIIARAISFVLGIILAKNFLPENTDIYLYLWSLINVVLVIVMQLNLMVVGPAYIRLAEAGEEKEAADLNSTFLNIYLVPILLFTLVTFLFPIFSYQVMSGFSGPQLIPFRQVLQFSGIWLALVIINSFIGNIFLSRKYFVVYILGQVIAASVTLILILILKNTAGINSFFIGQVAGNICCLLFYSWHLRGKLKLRLRFLHFRLPVKIVRELGAVLLVSVPTLIINFLLVFYLSHFITGRLSAFNYGSALANLPDAIFLSQFISVFGVRFSEIGAQQEEGVLFNTFRHFGNHLFFFMCGIAVIVSLASPVIVQMVYGKGSLGPDIFNSAALTLTLLAAALPFKALDTLNNRLFASIQALSSLVKYTFPIKILNIGLLMVFVKLYGFYGLLAHQIVMPVVMVTVQIFLLGKYFPAQKIKAYFGQVIFITVAGLVVYTGSRYLLSYLFIHIPPLLQLVLVCLLITLLAVIFERMFKLTTFNKIVFSKITGFLQRRKKSAHPAQE